MGANPDITHPSTEGRMLECPRCGYGLDAGPSLRGDAEGICTECGLAIRWEELVSTYTDPTWFVESRRRRPRIALRGLWTLARCAFPRAFWTRIPLSLPISARGILAFLVAVAVVAHIIAAIGGLEVERRSWRGRWITNADRIVGILTPLNSYAGRAIVANAGRLGPQATGIERASVILWTYAYTCDPIGLLAPPIDPRNGNPLHPSMGPVSRTGPLVDSVATARLQTAVLVPLLAPACLLLLPRSLRRAGGRTPLHTGVCRCAAALGGIERYGAARPKHPTARHWDGRRVVGGRQCQARLRMHMPGDRTRLGLERCRGKARRRAW